MLYICRLSVLDVALSQLPSLSHQVTQTRCVGRLLVLGQRCDRQQSVPSHVPVLFGRSSPCLGCWLEAYELLGDAVPGAVIPQLSRPAHCGQNGSGHDSLHHPAVCGHDWAVSAPHPARQLGRHRLGHGAVGQLPQCHVLVGLSFLALLVTASTKFLMHCSRHAATRVVSVRALSNTPMPC